MSIAVPSRSQDGGYWRLRYTEDLAKFEKQIESMREAEDLLRRIAMRLCIGLKGQTPELDGVIDQVQLQLRDGLSPANLHNLLLRLGPAIEALDHSAMDEASSFAELPRVLRELLERIQFDEALRPRAIELGNRLASMQPDQGVGEFVSAIAELVNLQNHGLQGSLVRFQTVFGRINERLSEMFEHVTQDSQDFDAVQQIGRDLEQQLLSEVNGLGQEVKGSKDLKGLQRQVERRMEALEEHLHDFRERADERGKAYKERADRMQARIAELEQQSSALRLAMRQQTRRALVDPLTGIPNRLAYHRQAEAFRKRAARGGYPVCLAIWDIDHFKMVNDTYGHQAGDKALRLVGRKLARSVRDSDFVARYGGEEFVMLLENTEIEQAIPLLNALRQAISETPFHHGGKPAALTISCGVTELTPGEDLDVAFERADAALYQSKNAGRNRVSSG